MVAFSAASPKARGRTGRRNCRPYNAAVVNFLSGPLQWCRDANRLTALRDAHVAPEDHQHERNVGESDKGWEERNAIREERPADVRDQPEGIDVEVIAVPDGLSSAGTCSMMWTSCPASSYGNG